VETPPPPVTPSTDQASLNALAAAAARAEAARKLLSDFEAGSYFPEEWQSAESLYAQAEQQRNTSTSQNARDSAARYNAAADAYEALIAKASVAAYDYAESELTAARDTAVAAGAQALIPDFLLAADNKVAKALEEYEAKDYYAAKDSALSAYDMYSAMIAGLDAYRIREEIAARGFEVYGQASIDIGDNALYAAADDYEAGNYEAAKKKADEALLLYSQVYQTAWESYSAKIRAETVSERQRALDLKADVAVKPLFDAAESVYVQANTAFNARRYEDSGALYERCRPMFADAAREALEKRLAAEEALRRADQRVAESDEAARNAERIVEGGL
jgi:transposase